VTGVQLTVPSTEAVSRRRRLLRDRWVILTGLGGITAAAWVYLTLGAPMSAETSEGSMADAMQSMVHVKPWAVGELAPKLLMWAVMMVAMMVPTAVPMTLVYTAVARKAGREDHPVAPTFVFVAGISRSGFSSASRRPPLRVVSTSWRSCHRRWCLQARCSEAVS
jgi:predicted metal-binding membrane protein